MLCLKQVLALGQRHWLNIVRNKWRTITPVVVSILLFALFAGFGKYNSGAKREERGECGWAEP